MDREIARHVARVAFRASADLGDLVPLIKEHCSQDEYQKLGRAITSASAGIGLDVLNLVFADFPDLKREFDENVKTYGRIL